MTWKLEMMPAIGDAPKRRSIGGTIFVTFKSLGFGEQS